MIRARTTRWKLRGDGAERDALDQAGDQVARRRDDSVFRPQIDGTSGSNRFLAHRSIAEPGKSAVVVQQVRAFREQAALKHGGVELRR